MRMPSTTFLRRPAAMTTSTALPGSATSTLIDPAYQQAALGFFGGIRLPASLIAGSSVAAVFSLTQQAKDTSGLTQAEVIVLRCYHAFSILSLCLSMTTVSTTTTASTLLLLGKSYSSNTSYEDVYHFLRGELNLEFVLTRWAFLSSIILFLLGVASRLLLELHLLRPGRRTGGVLVTCTMTCVLTGLFATMNQSLNCWPNLWAMSAEVAQLLWQRMVQTKSPLLIISFLSLLTTAGCVLKYSGVLDKVRQVLPNKIDISQLRPKNVSNKEAAP